MGWNHAAEVAPADTIVNCAVGGTVTSYWVENLNGVLAGVQPDVVLMYCGSNDLNGAITEAAIADNLALSRALVSHHSAMTRYAWFSIIKAPQKEGKWDLIDRLNAAVRARLLPEDLYIETNALYFQDGQPVSRLFQEDRLHLTGEAYDLLAAYARPLIAAWLAP